MRTTDLTPETEEYRANMEALSAWRNRPGRYDFAFRNAQDRYAAEARKRQSRRWHVWKLRHNALMRPGGGIFIETRARWIRVFYIPSWAIRLWRNHS